jgi:peptidoglycan/LPS O-acetylase OafA/YrhL
MSTSVGTEMVGPLLLALAFVATVTAAIAAFKQLPVVHWFVAALVFSVVALVAVLFVPRHQKHLPTAGLFLGLLALILLMAFVASIPHQR